MKRISSIETLNGICIFLLFQVFFLCIIEKSGVSFLKSPHISPKLVFFSSVSATHFRFNLLLFFSSLHLSIVFSFVPVPHDIHSKTGFPGRRHTEQADMCCPWWWCMYKCVERTGGTKRMSRLYFFILRFCRICFCFLFFLIFVIFFFLKFVLNVPPTW